MIALAGAAMKKKDSTEVMQVRESVGRNKIPLLICALLAIAGVIGWLNSL
jgi:predicted negative regulator of RcsB-dependent stress response